MSLSKDMRQVITSICCSHCSNDSHSIMSKWEHNMHTNIAMNDAMMLSIDARYDGHLLSAPSTR